LAWASERINVYKYRKEFGLTYEEFLNEDLEQFWINKTIMDELTRLERARAKASKAGLS